MEKTTTSRTSGRANSAKGLSEKTITNRNSTRKAKEPKASTTKSRNKTEELNHKTFLLHKTKGKKRYKSKQVSVSPWYLFAAVAVVILIFIINPMREHYMLSENIDRGAQIPSKIKGEYFIDISHHNDAKGVKWDSLKVMVDSKGRTIQDLSAAKNIYSLSGVIMKATEGSNMKDKLFRQYWHEVANTELKRGAYHFYRTSKNPKVQAMNFIRTVGDIRHMDLPPILDVETIHKGCSKEELNKGLLIWLKLVEERYGRTPIVYTYDSFAKDYISQEILDNYPIWIAHYKTENPSISKWDMWQFTDQALVYGFPTPVDLSISKIK